LSSSYGYQPGAFNRLTSTQQASYTFDANGNVTSKSEGTTKWYYSYDRENRLTNATKFGGLIPRAGENINYQYDALGRRVVRQDKKTGRTEFTHDGMDVLQDRLQKGDTTTTTNYVNGLGIDDKLKVTTGSTSRYFLTDHLGSTVGIADSNGNITESATYDSFGRTLSSSLTTRYQYTGREADEKTNLMYYRARFYDSQIGRFTSEDPIGFKGGDVNLYGYVWNNPQHFTDPSGLDVSAYYDRRKRRLVVYNNDTPPRYEYVQNPNPTDINQPVGYQEIRYDRHVFDEGIFSGDGNCKNNTSCELKPFDGPIPAGDYAISGNPDRRGWYWLRRKQPDGTYNDHALIGDSGVSRGNFRLHLGRISYGCLTFSLAESFKQLDNILKGTSKSPVFYSEDSKAGRKTNNARASGFLTVY
jgi:RHS repeat-associated protein